MEQHTYRYLVELSNSDFQIVEGEPDIKGWQVKSETGMYIGKIDELLFDPQTNAVRYLIIDLADNGLGIDRKKIMVPIGIAHLHTSDDEVSLPNLHLDQYNALPEYDSENIGPETEIYVRSVIGSPAALRIEDEIIKIDQEQFYNHHHFDRGSFYTRGGNPNRTAYNNSYRPGEHKIKPWLQPGASHNQGGNKGQ